MPTKNKKEFVSKTSGVQISSSTHFNGKHIVVGLQSSPVHLHVTRNASGHIMEMQGVAVNTLITLSRRFNFTYSILQVNDVRLEKQSNTLLGLHHYMKQGKCDLVIGSIAMTLGRCAVLDFVEGYAYTSIATVIPMPEELHNADAALQPFKLPVWIALVVIMPITAVAIYYFSRPLNFKKQSDESATTASSPEKEVVCSQINSKISKEEAFKQYARLFILSILTSYILGSNAKPLADSAIDAIENSKVNIAVNKGNGVDLVLSAAEVGFYKQAGDKLRSNPISRCDTTVECMNHVKSGSYAYLHTMYTAMNVIDEDFKATGVCHLALARTFEPMPGSLAWILPKNSPYTRLFNMGFMELHEAGMMDHWIAWELEKYRNATRCLQEALKRQQRKAASEKETKITSKNFSGPFDLLIVGYLVSFVLFVREIVHFKVSNYCLKRSSQKVTTEENEDVNGNGN
ncbi:hypothetical protein OUZ56_024986 [Daphnia magna]|uniref:Ionotropic glutamate receptor L-glutamate and glycine-binding domain-containing protein n=1 Tax=Daphnia magna TaxID=35525 RepID=A0ABQ9ZIK4_9CRUS|nr:hypothetical protein OUZ56_024986 [Daphnia magna]